MPKKAKHRHRQGKIATGGHSTRIEGLTAFLTELEVWPEISSIRIGPISIRNSVGRKSSKKLTSTDEGFVSNNGHKRPRRSEGGLTFRATRLAMIGSVVTGVKCDASYGRSVQQVVLTSTDLDSLINRLRSEGLCDNL